MLRRLRDEAGFTLVEMSVALILSAMVVATFVGVFFSFSQNTGDATAKAEHQEMTRNVVASLVVDLRQAVTADPNGYPIESIAPDKVVFYTMSRDAAEPVRVVFERVCVGSKCHLQVRRYAATSQVSGQYSFSSTPFEDRKALDGVLADQPLFGGIEWIGNPKARTTVVSCGGSGRECNFSLVSITLRSVPRGTSAGAATTLEIYEEVRLRNA